ncbi:MAG: hypothetical protein ACM35G_13300 [Planctomycetaceae bacterium]
MGEHGYAVGEAEVVLDGQPTKVAVFVLTLAYSDAIFCQAFPRECTEAFLEGHVRAFAFLGGVPRRISYDDSKIAVAKITASRDCRVTGEFLRLQSHHLFEDHFCLVRWPHEQGHIETLVGYARRNFLVPVPVLHALEQYACPDREQLAVLQLFRAQRPCGTVQTPPAFPRLRCSSTRRCTNE